MATLKICCSILLIISIVLLVSLAFFPLPDFTSVLIGIGGFAGIVKLYIPVRNDEEKINRVLVAVLGTVIMIIACFIA